MTPCRVQHAKHENVSIARYLVEDEIVSLDGFAANTWLDVVNCEANQVRLPDELNSGINLQEKRWPRHCSTNSPSSEK